MQVLPLACHHLMITAAVDDGVHDLPLPHTVDVDNVLRALEAQIPPLKTLSIEGSSNTCSRVGQLDGDAVKRDQESLVRLQHLTLRGIAPLRIPTSLTALTTLFIHSGVVDAGWLFTPEGASLPV